jgi:hypothetical protein
MCRLIFHRWFLCSYIAQYCTIARFFMNESGYFLLQFLASFMLWQDLHTYIFNLSLVICHLKVKIFSIIEYLVEAA